MALAMCFALAVSTSAATAGDVAGTHTVRFLKNGQSSTSMSDKAVGDRTATVSVADGVATVTISLQPIRDCIGADGWVEGVSVNGMAQAMSGSGGEVANIKNFSGIGTYRSNFYFYDTATLVITMDTLSVVDGKIVISNVKPTTELVLVNTKKHNILPTSMTNAAFDIELTRS